MEYEELQALIEDYRKVGDFEMVDLLENDPDLNFVSDVLPEGKYKLPIEEEIEAYNKKHNKK